MEYSRRHIPENAKDMPLIDTHQKHPTKFGLTYLLSTTINCQKQFIFVVSMILSVN